MNISDSFITTFKRALPTPKFLKREFKQKYFIPIKGFIQAANERLLVHYSEVQLPERQLIKDMGMTIQLFNKIVQGTTHVTIYELIRIAEVLGYDVDFKFTKKEQTNNDDQN